MTQTTRLNVAALMRAVAGWAAMWLLAIFYVYRDGPYVSLGKAVADCAPLLLLIGAMTASGLLTREQSVFAGRIGRGQYWAWVVVVFVVSGFVWMSLAFGVMHLDKPTLDGQSARWFQTMWSASGVAALFGLSAPVVRRLHDRGKSGSCFWFLLIPIFSLIYLVYIGVEAGQTTANEYGEAPGRK